MTYSSRCSTRCSALPSRLLGFLLPELDLYGGDVAHSAGHGAFDLLRVDGDGLHPDVRGEPFGQHLGDVDRPGYGSPSGLQGYPVGAVVDLRETGKNIVHPAR